MARISAASDAAYSRATEEVLRATAILTTNKIAASTRDQLKEQVVPLAGTSSSRPPAARCYDRQSESTSRIVRKSVCGQPLAERNHSADNRHDIEHADDSASQ